MSLGNNTEDKDSIQTYVFEYFSEILESQIKSKEELRKNIITCNQEILEIENELKTINSEQDKLKDYFSPTSAKNSIRIKDLEKSMEWKKNNIFQFLSKIEEIDLNIDRMGEMQKFFQSEISSSRYSNNKFCGEFGLSILEVQELERKRIARELHDSTVQNLTSLVHKAELCLKLIDIDVIRSKLELHTMTQTIGTIINDMRAVIYDLRPMSIDDIGLVVTVERFIDKLMMEDDRIQINFLVTKEEVKILPVINLSLFRVIQEACNNAKNHANANIIDIKLEYFDKHIELTVKDNGRGFDQDKLSKLSQVSSTNFGLSMMKERVCLLSGDIDIHSKENEGTTIFVKVPFDISAEEKNETNKNINCR